MKSYKVIILLCSIYFLIPVNTFAQESKYSTDEFEVKGVCNECKTRIENAAYIKGVKHCEWNKETGIFSVSYNPKKVELLTIHKSIAEVGHTTSKVEANKDAYDKLPACCAYDNGVHKH